MNRSLDFAHAVIIGVGQDLPQTERDAAAIANALTDRYGYQAANVDLLTGPRATRNEVLATLLRLPGRLTRDATALVYFSGHGALNPSPYILTHGYDLDDLPHTAISGAELARLLEAIYARRLVVILDCCHAGAQAKAPLAQVALPFDPEYLLKQGAGRVVIASSRGDELSYAGEQYSYFTQAILEALGGAGASERDGFARVLDIALHAREVVPARTRGRQHPIIKVKDLSDNFPVAFYGDRHTAHSIGETRGGLESALAPAQTGASSRHAHLETLRGNHRQILDLIEEKASWYTDRTAIPLDLLQAAAWHRAVISDLEAQMNSLDPACSPALRERAGPY